MKATLMNDLERHQDARTNPCLPALFLAALLATTGCSSDAKTNGDPSTTSFNEINAAGDEWLELYNGGEKPLDLSLYSLADTDKDTGMPRTAKAMRFPPGTTLDAGGFLLVLLNKKDSTPGPYAASACLPGVAAGCLYALFSISESRGEAIHLLDPDGKDEASVNYPADLALTADSGLTACRLPDGHGDLTTCTATPGSPNAAP